MKAQERAGEAMAEAKEAEERTTEAIKKQERRPGRLWTRPGRQKLRWRGQ